MLKQTTERYGKRRLMGTFGDCNFLEHGGGIVYRGTYPGYNMVYFENRYWLSDDENTPRKWLVYECDLDPNYISESKLKDVFDSCGFKPEQITFEQFEAMLHSENPMEVAFVFEQCAYYEGWSNFDWHPELMTKTEIRQRFGRWVD